LLEDTVEEMSTTFIGLSDSVLESEHIQSHPQLITSIGESVKRALTLAENATRSTDEGAAATDDDPESPPDQAHALVQLEGARNVPIASTQGEPSTAARFLKVNEIGMQDYYLDPPFEAGASTEAVAGPGNLFLKVLGECLRKTLSSRKNSGEATTPLPQTCTWWRGPRGRCRSGNVCYA
jgi:hypothetical protein